MTDNSRLTLEDEAEPDAPELEEVDPHTQREVYSALALPPESGLGPKILAPRSQPEPERPARNRAPRSRKPAAPGQRNTQPLTVIRHESRCSICKHPDRAAIDEAIRHWEPPTRIALEFKLGSRLAVYRHARTLGLFEQRVAKTRHCLAQIMEQAGSVVPSAGDVIRAVRAFSCLDDTGRWTEPRREVVVTHQYAELPSPKPAARVQRIPQLPAPASAASANREPHRPTWRRLFRRRFS